MFQGGPYLLSDCIVVSAGGLVYFEAKTHLFYYNRFIPKDNKIVLENLTLKFSFNYVYRLLWQQDICSRQL